MQRILAVFDPAEQEAVRIQLAYCLKAVICQQLLPTPNQGRKAVQEIMVNTPAIQEAILSSEFDKLNEYMRNGAYDGMQTMDNAVYEAFSSGAVEGNIAVDFAINREEMERSLKSII
jgi:Tfp pilus assembly pilus retraction ATPase PilT